MFIHFMIVLFSIPIFLLFYFWCVHKSVHSKFKNKDVKFLPGVMYLGNFYESGCGRKHFIEDIKDVCDAFPNEKYVGLIANTSAILLVKDPELIKDITVKDFDHFVDHNQAFSIDNEPLFGSSLVMMTGEKWRNMRITLTPAFTGSKMRQMVPFMDEIANNIIEYLKENLDTDTDVSDLVRRYTMDVIASAGFGLQINSVRDRDNEFFVIGQNLFKFTLLQNITLLLTALFPSLVRFLKLGLFPEKTRQFFRDVVSSTIEFRKKNNIERPDMIQLLMESNKEWTLDDIISQVFLFFIAGFDTSANSLTMCIHELAINSEVQEKLYNEIKEFSSKNKINYDNINELKYLDCVVNETLRKWTVAVFMDRSCTKPYELPPPREGGIPYKIKPGDVVYNAVQAIHMDPRYFPNPEKFDPERFSDENKHNIKPFTYMPFGVGPRNCIGSRFGLLQLKVLLYRLVLDFKIVKCEKTADPIKLQPGDFNIKAAGGSWVRFELRK